MKTEKYLINNVDELSNIAFELGKKVKSGDVICLNGDLGAGKTTFTKGLARGLEVHESQYVSSPSFAIMHEYDGRLTLYHMDFYRLNSVDEIFDLGFEELLYGDGVSVIEWSERMGDYLPERRLVINFEITGDTSRNLIFNYIDKK